MHSIILMKEKVIYLKMVNSIKSDWLFALAEYCLGPLTYNYLKKLPDFDHGIKGGEKKEDEDLFNLF